MKTSQVGINLIKKWESFVESEYLCPAGLCTIGYGHVILNNEKFPKSISEIYAEDLLRRDVERFEHALNKHMFLLKQNQFDALIFLCLMWASRLLRTPRCLR